MAKQRFAPGEQVVVSDALDATIYTIGAMYEGGVVDLYYTLPGGTKVSGGESHTSLLKYPKLGQYAARGEI